MSIMSTLAFHILLAGDQQVPFQIAQELSLYESLIFVDHRFHVLQDDKACETSSRHDPIVRQRMTNALSK
jgi:hypothetical protein